MYYTSNGLGSDGIVLAVIILLIVAWYFAYVCIDPLVLKCPRLFLERQVESLSQYHLFSLFLHEGPESPRT